MLVVRIVVDGAVGSVAASALGPLIADRESFSYLTVSGQAAAAAVLVLLSNHGHAVRRVTQKPTRAAPLEPPGPRIPPRYARSDQ